MTTQTTQLTTLVVMLIVGTTQVLGGTVVLESGTRVQGKVTEQDDQVRVETDRGTSIGTDRGSLTFSHTGRPRFRTFRWETDDGVRKIQLPTQTSIKIRRGK